MRRKLDEPAVSERCTAAVVLSKTIQCTDPSIVHILPAIMTASDEGGVEEEGQPYCWDEGPVPSAEVLQLWVEVGNGLDKNQTG